MTRQLFQRLRLLRKSRSLLAAGLFDGSFYLQQNPDLREHRLSPFIHYLRRGTLERRSPHPLFDAAWYLEQNADVAAAGLDPLIHYLDRGGREGCDPHPLFDSSFYLERNPDVAQARIAPLQHYVMHGAIEGRSPHPLFDAAWYLEQNADVADAGLNPLIHYLDRGWKEGRDPHPLFDSSFYLERYPDVARAGIAPLQHYVMQGANAGRSPHPLFDAAWYLERNPDEAAARLNPLIHYLDHGWKEGCDPHPLFDSSFYLERNPDVAQARIAPLQHYVMHGAIEGRSPQPLFDAAWYLERNADVAAAGPNPLIHYLDHGWKEGRDPHPLFDSSFYLERNPDVAQAGIAPLQQYVMHGAYAGRSPHALFDAAWYLDQNPQLAAAGLNPLIHYLDRGWKEGRDPHPLFDASFYLERNPDVSQARIAPLCHYATQGAQERRSPHPLFDAPWYLDRNPQVAAAGLNPLSHYLDRGWKEGCDPHALFKTDFYLEQNPEIAILRINPLLNYLLRGPHAGRDPNPLFDASFYLERYPAVAASGVNPLIHYVLLGAAEGRSTNRWTGMLHPQTLLTVCGKEEWTEYGRNKLASLLSSQDDLAFSHPESPEVSIILVFHNKAHLSLLCLDSIRANANVSYELIVVDNNSSDETGTILGRCQGATIIRSPENRGFGEACTLGAARATGEYLFFLNNDTLLEPGAISAALQTFANDSVGCVGGKVLLSTGDLQEAGSILWSDGSTYGYGRMDQPDLPQYEFRRPVDYCSGACLITPRNLFFRLGGFDPLYGLGYYEDVDYCMKVWAAGLRVVYDPRCVIRHFENATSGGGENLATFQLISANRSKFCARWEKELPVHGSLSATGVLRGRIASQSKGLHILYLDDRVPHRDLGDQYRRSNDILHALLKGGHHVMLASMHLPMESLATEYRDISQDVELIDATVSGECIRQYLPTVDVVWISKPRNLDFVLERMTEVGRLSAKIVYEPGSTFSDRQRLHISPRSPELPSKILEVRIKRDVALAVAADAVIVQTPSDLVNAERENLSNVHMVSHSLAATPTPASFDCRKTFLFIGAQHSAEDANVDPMRYFCSEIWPELRRRTGAELVVADSGIDIDMCDIDDGVRIVGSDKDLASVYNEARVFISPARYAAGIPFEVHDAAARGVPAVVSDPVGQSLGWKDGTDVLIAKDAATFCDCCCELFTNENLWRELRGNALARIRAELNPVLFEETIFSVLASVEMETQDGPVAVAVPGA